MIKKSITYTDYNGVKRTEDFWFNLNKAEMLELEWDSVGGFDAYIKRIVNAKDNREAVEVFKSLIDKSYGIKSEDGRYFRKSEEALADFKSSEAYVELYIGLLGNVEDAAVFIYGIIPDDMKENTNEKEIAAKAKAIAAEVEKNDGDIDFDALNPPASVTPLPQNNQ